MTPTRDLGVDEAEGGKDVVRAVFGTRHDRDKLSPSVISSSSIRELDEHEKTTDFFGDADGSSRNAGQFYGGFHFVAYSDHALVWNSGISLFAGWRCGSFFRLYGFFASLILAL